MIQNGDGRAPTRWNRSGLIVEVLPFRQYRVKYDGSGRLQVRNRQHLKPFVPPANNIAPHHPPTPSLLIPDDQIPAPVRTSTPIRSDLVMPRQFDRNLPWRADTETIMASPQRKQAPSPTTRTVDIETMIAPSPQPPSTSQPDGVRNQHPDAFTLPAPVDASESETIPYEISKELPENVRKSNRIRRPAPRLSPKLRGKSHR